MSAHHAFVLAVLATLSLMCPSPVRSMTRNLHDTCSDCIASESHKARREPCVYDYRSSIVAYACQPGTPTTFPEFYTEKGCTAWCEKTNKCLCNGQCYVCAPPDTDTYDFFPCKIPTMMFGEDCAQVPFVAPA